ncbi:MAG: RnfABCDGE type electron transport complex subunit G [Mucinivorans sp.]
MKSTLKNMVLVLGIITLVASGAVAGVFILTKSPIAQAKTDKINVAIADVMPSFDNDPAAEKLTKSVDGQTINVYPAKSGKKIIGYAIETFSKKGFGGQMSLMVGMLIDGTINKISVIEHKETPGLGDKIDKAKSDFSVQFEGKNPSEFQLLVTKDGGDVDAITASTISSRAYCDALERAAKIFNDLKANS